MRSGNTRKNVYRAIWILRDGNGYRREYDRVSLDEINFSAFTVVKEYFLIFLRAI
jgi:hypothetical protein